jgi:lipopolysaccharide/colanic/teichoic acid biosynthesis glycosyltransferase
MKGGKKEKKTKVVKSKKTKTPKSKSSKSKTAKKENPWLTHVKKTMKEYPNKKFKDVLVLAKKSYKKM